jgi:diguanylate cyclase (GGDEF)-like protein
MMDLDDFKRTNDALGHDAGDALLVEFTKRLRASVRPDDVVARFGGDEFAVMLRDAGSEVQVQAAVSSIVRSLEVPFTYDGKLLDIRCTIGASNFPVDGLHRLELMKKADIALYVAKASARGSLVQYRADMRAEVQRRMSMLSLAKQAVREDRIVPHYQPKFNLRTGQLDGFEALLRWQHTNKRFQKPATIQAAFNDFTLAAEISDKMIDAVVLDVRQWQADGVEFGHVAVNAGAAELRKGDFADKLLDRLHSAEVSPASIQVEVTESVFLGRGAERVENTLKALAAEGIQIALDDFGTGYASLSHLNQFPVHVLKIDRSFVSKSKHSSHDAAIVRAVVNLGRSLGIKIVAEGVENEAQVDFLRKLRCDYVQGYLFAQAQAASTVSSLVTDWREGHPELRSAR